MDLVSAKDDWDVAASKEMITEVVSDKKRMMAKKIIELLGDISFENENASKAAKILATWNGDNQLEDIAPTIFAKLQYKILELTCKDELSELDFSEFLTTVMSRRSLPFLLEKEASPWWDNQATRDKKETRKEILLAAFEATLTEIEGQLGTCLLYTSDAADE